jgi:hypothetical protein
MKLKINKNRMEIKIIIIYNAKWNKKISAINQLIKLSYILILEIIKNRIKQINNNTNNKIKHHKLIY